MGKFKFARGVAEMIFNTVFIAVLLIVALHS